MVSEMSWLMRLLERGRTEKFMETILDYNLNKANQVLQLSDPNNRKITLKTVRNYAHDMLLDQWLDNGEAFKFSNDDMLLDGHHRSHAVCLAAQTNPNISIPVTMIFGLDKNVRSTIDLGKVRSPADRFKIEMQVDYGEALSTAFNLIEARAKGKVTFGGKDIFTIQDILAKYDKNRHTYDNVANKIVGEGCSKKLGEGVLIAAYIIMSEEPGMDLSKLRIFFNQLIYEEELDSQGHIAELRKRLGPRQLEKNMRGYRAWQKLELIFRYWDYWINDRALPSRPLASVGSYPKISIGREDNGKEEDTDEVA
jgi:hypothetical protein